MLDPQIAILFFDLDPIPRELVFDAHTDWARDAERRGDVGRAQLIRDNRWRQCPHGPAELEINTKE